jgi:sensor histidine kinase YesM
MAKDFLEESRLVDLTDEALKELLGGTYHTLKNLDEEKKNDPDIQQMRDQLRLYIEDNYSEEQKRLKARLKAARSLATARGIHWTIPE